MSTHSVRSNDSAAGRAWRPEDLPEGPVVKICGLTRAEDVLLACDLGAWALGFVFAPSPRRLAPAAARELLVALALRRAHEAATAPAGDTTTPPGARPLAIGVFVDVSAAEIAEVVEEVGLDGVQLHSPAGPGASAVRAALSGGKRPVLVIQAVPIDPGTTGVDALMRAVATAYEEADVVLLDTRTAGRFGGSGTVFPWRLARDPVRGAPVLVAGGINPENVQAALRQSGAWGVDVSSGVEQSRRIKDARLMGRLFANVGAMAGGRALAQARAAALPGAAGDDSPRQEGPDQ